ncbi:putative nuclease HARBI1 [Palaemon carinicauda]|uniref:putative nuclease HARBI1 n=1 Tax=Palaemon carinicauda TaxID=392227 RepID=UPI0035B5E71D
MTILRELKHGHEADFINYMRMDPNTFYKILSKVEPYIMKEDTNMRQSISTEARLHATLLFLSTGCSYRSLQYSTRISKLSLSAIIPETCKQIYEVLREDYLKTPSTPEEWKNVSNDFWRMWNFPNCLGAIDGKHIVIRQPPGSGSYFYNYKGTYSIILMAICDANSNFIYVDVGVNGRVSDGGVWANTSISQSIVNHTAGLPEDTKLPGSDKTLPFVFLVDDAFPLQRHIMKPYPYQKQTTSERIFSYRLSRERRTVENGFGMLANRFRVFLAPITLPPEKVDIMVLACTALHNFLRKDEINQYSQPEGCLETECLSDGIVAPGEWRQTSADLLGLQVVGRNASIEGKVVREKYMEYFQGEGAVSWQNKFLNDSGNVSYNV